MPYEITEAEKEQLKKQIREPTLDSPKEFIKPKYEQITEMVGAFIKLYEICEDKSVVDELIRSVVFPSFYIP